MQQCCNMKINEIYKRIRKEGGRITKTRREIIQTLFHSEYMLSIQQIASKLKTKPDRTTIYRELLFLFKKGIASKSVILSKDYFEIAKEPHHHLICIKCNSFRKIFTCNKSKEEKIAKDNKFKITNHLSDFYGLCHNCQKK